MGEVLKTSERACTVRAYLGWKHHGVNITTPPTTLPLVHHSISHQYVAILAQNKTPKVVSVGCVCLWKHNGVLSEFKKIRETTGKMCRVMSIDD